jgi:hypothetical protein
MGQGAFAGRQMDAMERDKKAKVARRNRSVDHAVNQWGMSQPEAEAMIADGGFWNEMKSRRAQAQKSDQSNRTAKFIAQKHGMPYENALIIAQSDQVGEYLKPQKPSYRQITGDDAKAMGLNSENVYNVGPQGRVSQIGGNGTTVNIGAGSKLTEALDKSTGSNWADYQKQGAVAGAMAADLEVLQELGSVANTGPLTGRLAQMFPGFDDASTAFQSIVKRVAPSMRAEGSGSQSDVEYRGFLDSLPSLSNNPEANTAIIKTLQAKAKIDVARSEIVTAFRTGQIDQNEAMRQMAELNQISIMSPELKAAIQGTAPKQATPEGGGGTTRSGINFKVIQ